LCSFLSRHIIAGFDPTSKNWLADIRKLPKPASVPIDIEFINDMIERAVKRDQARWPGSTFDTVSLFVACLILLAQHCRCAVTANVLTCVRQQLNTMRCACSAKNLCRPVVDFNFICSLDAIDPQKPHTADNVQWVCLRINLGNARALVCLLHCISSYAKQASAPPATATFASGPACACVPRVMLPR